LRTRPDRGRRGDERSADDDGYGEHVRRLTFLLRPGWVILALVVAAFAYMCFSVLAPWQLGKNVRTSHRNDLIAASVKAEPAPVQQLLGPGLAGAPADDEWRRVDVTGSYLPDATVLVRLRSVEETPAFEVLTALRLDDGRVVLVDRGYVSPIGADGDHPPAAATVVPPTGEVTVRARVRRSEGVIANRSSITRDGYRQVYSIDSGQVGALLATPLVAGYLQTEGGQPGAFRPVELPQLDAGPYLSYGLQWLAFGIMAPLGLGYFVRAEWIARRKDRRAQQHPPPDTEPTPDTEPDPTPALTPNEARLADRYGRR
jgi:cytochrome oxidase assembly protein ShyY1